MSETLHVVCVECRQETFWGTPYGDGPRWRVHSPVKSEVFEAFGLAHRGHVLGIVEGGTLDVASDRHGEIATVDTVAEILAAHPHDLDEADRIAEPSDLLKGLLGSDG